MARLLPLHPEAFLAETKGLSPRDLGALMRLLMHRFTTGELPQTAAGLAKVVGVSVFVAEQMKPRLEAFFVSGNFLDIALQVAEVRYQRRARAGRLGGQAKHRAQHAAQMHA